MLRLRTIINSTTYKPSLLAPISLSHLHQSSPSLHTTCVLDTKRHIVLQRRRRKRLRLKKLNNRFADVHSMQRESKERWTKERMTADLEQVWRENGLTEEPPILSVEKKRELMVRWGQEGQRALHLLQILAHVFLVVLACQPWAPIDGSVLVHLWQKTDWKNWENCFFAKTVFSQFRMELGRSGGVQGDRTDRTKTAQQIFERFGLAWHRKVHFSTFSGKLTFQSTRNCSQNPPFCPGSLQDTFIIYSSISHQHMFQTYFAKNK